MRVPAGWPIIGVETLKLQGLPVDDIMLSCESEPQLRDFAGNAMTTTVVGAAMLCAFAVAAESLHGPGHMDNTEEDEARYAAEAAASADQAGAASAAATGMLHGGMRKLTCTDVQPNNNIEWMAIPMDLSGVLSPIRPLTCFAFLALAKQSSNACVLVIPSFFPTTFDIPSLFLYICMYFTSVSV